AESIIKNAKAETKRMEKAGEDAVTQAGRNMILAFRDALTAELDKIVRTETVKAYSKELMTKLIPETVKAWTKNTDAGDLSVLLSEKDLKELQSGLTAALKSEIAKGLEIKPDKTLANGFRIGIKNGAAFYDYSAESLAELFSSYLNPRTAELMKGAAEGIK
ncbi:MAG TPA: V-type ATP synthase subunit E, partial [Treponema sp.]|nr:V-type ATP synthase subunit E [Treponema sp.]